MNAAAIRRALSASVAWSAILVGLPAAEAQSPRPGVAASGVVVQFAPDQDEEASAEARDRASRRELIARRRTMLAGVEAAKLKGM
jgi:hypothetical protein